MTRIGLVGAGYISQVHGEALAVTPGCRITAIVDPNHAAAAARAKSLRVDSVFASVDEALQANAFDRAHVLVPPDLHAAATQPLLEAGKPVLLEKPLAVSRAQCDALLATAAASGAALGVNQNFVYHPAFVRLRALLDARTLGRPGFVDCLYNVPLRQMAARQFGHWMFRAPGNILLEQAVHPLSQIVALAGEIGDVRAIAGTPIEIAPGVPFHTTLSATLSGQSLPAQLRFAVGQSFPFWQIRVVCDDGVAVADILANRVFTYGRTRWMEAVDGAASGTRSAAALARDSMRNLADYALSTLHVKGPTDPFFQSMRGSIGAFHAALDAGRAPPLDGRFGASLVGLCQTIAEQVFAPATPRLATPRPATPASAPAAACDVAILGGTGFIGVHTVRRCLDAGLRVSVMARSIANLPAVFDDDRVVLQRGDIRDADDVAGAIDGAPVVVNLAHGGGGTNWEAIRAAMVGGAEIVARACQKQGVRRLVHVGSIASLYLGPQAGTVTGATPPDPQETKRGDYARAKVLCDRMLLEMHAREGLPVCILRPGVVVGDGTSPFHSGVGLFNNDQHCIGWNAGRNPLPFVLVQDVAEAIFRATQAEGVVGKCYNLVGDVRLSARDYLAELARAQERPLRFHPQFATKLWIEDVAKWLVKRATGRAVPMPDRRDFLSRGMMAAFDCGDAKRDLGWQPVAERGEFLARAIRIHAA